MEENVATASFFVWLVELERKIVICVVVRRKKSPWFLFVVKRKKHFSSGL